MFASLSRRCAFLGHNRCRRSAMLAMGAALAAVPVFAGGAQAAFKPVGQVTLDTKLFGFTGTADGVSTVRFNNTGQLQYTWNGGVVSAHLTGTVHVDDGQNAQFRVRIDSRDANDKVLGTTYDRKRGTPITTSSQDISVDMAAVSAPNLNNVLIVIEEKSTTAKWDNRGQATEAVQPHTDDVMVLGTHIDAGGPIFSPTTGAPTALPPATIAWSLGSDGALTATYNGYLHLDGLAGSARVVLRAINPFTHAVIAETDGPTDTSDGAGHDVYGPETISVTSSFAPSVDVVTQSFVSSPSGDHWSDIASQNISAGE
jgi:hypothetical protein